jgi:phosphatidylethanolamine/phosphatidyl-N-methylethanolamine N-methyltransferase
MTPKLTNFEILRAYKRYSFSYDVLFGWTLNPGRKSVIKRMNCQPGAKVLEVGVGTGLSLPMYESNVDVIGIDLSKEMLECAVRRTVRLNLKNVVDLRVMSGEMLEYEDASFDKVVAMYVASVVSDPLKLVNEMRRVCRPGGEVYIVNHFASKHALLKGVERLLANFSGVLGFRPDITFTEVDLGKSNNVVECQSVNFFGYWTMLVISP